MQHVELAERDMPVAHLIHRALVFPAPGVREGEPVDRDAKRLEHLLGLARDAVTPIDQRAEDVEQQSLGFFGHDDYTVNGLPFSGAMTLVACPFISATNLSALASMIGNEP